MKGLFGGTDDRKKPGEMVSHDHDNDSGEGERV